MSETPTSPNSNQEPQAANPENLQSLDEQKAQKIEQIASKPEEQRTLEETAILDAFKQGAQAAVETFNVQTTAPETTSTDSTVAKAPESNQNENSSSPAQEQTEPALPETRSVDQRTISKDLLQATERRIENTQAEIDLNKGWGEDVSKKEEQLQGDKDFKEYLEGRDFKDEQGNVHDAETGRFKREEDANSKPEEQTEPYENPYRNLNMDQLLDEWAEAEDAGDRTKSMDIQDVIQDKLINVSGVTEDHKMNLIDTAYNQMMKRRKNQEPGEQAPTATAETNPTEAPSQEQAPTATAETNPTEAVDEIEASTLEFVAAKSTDLAKEIDRLAGILSDRDRDAYKDKKGLSKVLSLVWRKGFKHSTWFEPETKRRIASNLLEQLGKDADLSALTAEDIDKLYTKNGLEPPKRQEQEMLASVADGVFGPNGALGRKISGEGQSDTPELSQFRGGLKGLVLEYVANHSTNGLTDEQREALTKDYQAKLSELVSEFMKSNPNFSQESIAQIANNGAELLSRALATSRHEEGMDRLSSQLDTMRIDLGEIQTGSYNNVDTRYLEQTIALQRKRNTARIVGKSAILAGSWAAATVVASTLSRGAAEALASSTATKAATLGTAFAIGGPIAALATTIGMAYVVGKVRGEKSQGRDEDLRGVESAYGTKSAEGLEGASDHLETYESASSSLMPFMKLRDGVDPDSATARDYILRDDLSDEELVEYTKNLARITAKLDIEARYNEESADLAEVQNARNRGFVGGLRNAFRGKSNPNARAYAVFSAASREDYLPQRQELLRLVSAGTTGIDEHYPGAELTQGENSMSIEDFMGAVYTQQRVTTETEISQLQKESETRIKEAGKKAGKTAAIVAGTLAVGGAAVAELATSGRSRTIFDIFGSRPRSSEALTAMSGTHIVKGSSEIITDTNYGSSGANIKDGILSVTNPQGQVVKVPVLPDGSLSPDSISKLAGAGVEASQTVGATKSVGMADFMAQNGGKRPSRIDMWLNNDTSRKYDGTELTTRRFKNPDGSLRWSQDFGIAHRGSTSIDLAQAGSQGRVSIEFISGDTAVRYPLVAQNGRLEVIFSPDDPMRDALFTKGGNFKGDMVHTLVEDGSGRVMSVASIPGLGQESVQTASRSIIELSYAAPTPIAPSTGYTLNGVVPTPLRRQFEKPEDNEEASESESSETPNKTEQPTTESPTSQTNDENIKIIRPEDQTGEIEEPATTSPPILAAQPTTTTQTQQNTPTPQTPEPAQTSAGESQEAAPATPEAPGSVQVEPLSPQDITDRLQEPDKVGTHLTINDERMEIKSADQGNIIMTIVDGPRAGQDISISSLDMANSINSGSVMIEDFLGANNAEEIANDFQDGEVLYDKELGGYVKIQKNGDSYTYTELDENGAEIPSQKSRSYLRQALIFRLSHGLLRPLQSRGVKTLDKQTA